MKNTVGLSKDAYEMDTDEILTAIGSFGPVQRRICYTQSVVQIFMAVHMFIPSFIGLDPGWVCSVSSSSNGSKVVVAEQEKCLQYERGDCTVEYSKEFTSTVTEVGLLFFAFVQGWLLACVHCSPGVVIACMCCSHIQIAFVVYTAIYNVMYST